jgi:hypothetical protein
VLAGAATNWCIRATAYGALDRGYDLTLIKDAHTTGTMELDSGVRIEAAIAIQELNIAMTWLAYPGRENGTATAAEVNFGNPGGVQEAVHGSAAPMTAAWTVRSTERGGTRLQLGAHRRGPPVRLIR